ncbi:hypothetical protein [Psychroserpens sp. Hel_I_66]|uniref:hypothetical protein n=1 Tax=Psychroserpens sp. Hel_I_66 TaxID=1250004 RepID=UPI0006476B1A|nr:hypothetical protein [Psychroserpens sp. Hel_I_66]
MSSQQLAFPSAEGAGAFITGGRGGVVVRVSNLNPTGPGSLRNALLMTMPRTIVFDVSGRINLTSLLELGVANSNFTVAGQTAPEGGITISGKPIQMGNSSQPCNNGIWRYIRFRNGSYTGQNDVYDHNGFISNGTDGLIFDHCSFSFCDDQAISMDSYYGPLKNITIQRCTFSENSTQIILGLGGNYERGDMTFSNNLFVDVTHRTPNMGGNLQWDLINNVYFNWGNRLANANKNSPKINHIGNYYKLGSYSSTERANVVQSPSTPIIYTANNYHTTFYPTPQLDDRDLWTDFYYQGQALPANRFTTTQHELLGQAPILKSPELAYTDITSDVGANRYLNEDGTFGEYADSFDTLKISNVLNSISSNPSNKVWVQPTLPNNTRPDDFDTDNDGMPDVWELNRFNNLNNNGQSDSNNNGYTELEDYLNGVDGSSAENAGSQVIIIANTEALCQGETRVLTASGADSYLWNTGETTPTLEISPDSTTTYTVTGTHIDGSTTQDEITITVYEVPIANAGPDQEICLGSQVTLTATGGTTYQWSTGATSATITVTPTGSTTYTVEVFQNACSSQDQVAVTVSEVPTVDAGEDQTIFEGQSATLTATGADTYLWSTGETTQSIIVNPLLDTSYFVNGTTNNCENTDTVTVFLLDDSVNANAGADTEVCTGQTTTLTATGGATYEWSTGETTASIEVYPTETTIYTVTAFSASGNNTDGDSVTVTVNEIPSANAGEDVTICFGNTATLTASGGTDYLWSTGETTQSITVNPEETTTYSVEVTTNSCSDEDDVIVNVNELPNISAGSDVTITEGESTVLTANGADEYLWSTGETTASITVSPYMTTTYSVTGISNGCESSDDIIVSVETENVTAYAGADVEICFGNSITLTATGGSSYLWNTGETSSTIEVSPSETTIFSVIAYNSSGSMSDEDDVTVTVNELPNISAGSDVTITEGESTVLTANGADEYLWSTGETTASITVSPYMTTTYSVTGISNGCESSDDIIVSVEMENVSANAGADVEICFGNSITLTATGGSSYLWNTGETSSTIEVSPSETTIYSVIAYNSSGSMSDEDDVIVNVNELPNTSAGSDVTITEGESTVLTANGADEYLWNTGETTASITVSPNVTTTYSVTGISNGCESSDDVIVSVEIENVTANAGADVEICFGNSTTLTATGGSTYEWSTGETTASIEVSPSETTTYTVIAFNSFGSASDQDEVIVSITDLSGFSAGEDVAILDGESIVLTANGADTYLWSTGETTASISVSPNATVSYSVTGFINGCESTDEVLVTVSYIVSAGANQTICQGYETTLTATEGDSYLWSTGETTQSITVNPTNTQVFSVTITIGDFEGNADVTVNVNPNPNVVIANGGDVMILEGEFVTLSASGANSYLWNNGATQPNIAVSPSVTTTFEVTGFINNCEDTKAVVVNVVEIVEADAGEDVTICNQETVTLTANGGEEYLWSTGETTQSIEVSPNEDTEYSVLVYNALDSDEDTIVVYVEQCSTVELPVDSDEFDVIIFQDQNTDQLKVKIEGLQSINPLSYNVYSMRGKVLYTERLDQVYSETESEMTKELDVSNFARGVYIVQLLYDDKSLIKQIPIR